MLKPWEILPDGFWSIQLDIVGFLAILGEASVLANGQVAALSKTCLLPRLIPAPQALIRTSRPERLHPTTGTVIGFESGNVRRQVNHIPHILHQVAFHKHKLGSAESTEYQVRAIGLRWAPDLPDAQKDIDVAVTKATSRSKAGKKSKAIKQRSFGRQWGPLVFLAYGGFLQSIALLIISATQGDGMSVLAVVLLSICSSLVGLASHWNLCLPKRTADRDVPPSDVVISYPNGSFLIIRCPEDIARLYFQAEQCEYLIDSVWQYRVICLLASVLLMFGVICLANATILLQVIWAAAYIVLNAAYWTVAALPARWHWDMTSFETTQQDYEWYRFKKGDPEPALESSRTPGENFTEALWKAIAITKNKRWARIGEVAPNTSGWDNWLDDAMRAARNGVAPAESPAGDEKKTDSETGKSTPETEEEKKQPSHDVESLKDSKSGQVITENPSKMFLPAWNYSAALTMRMREYNEKRKRDSW